MGLSNLVGVTGGVKLFGADHSYIAAVHAKELVLSPAKRIKRVSDERASSHLRNEVVT